MNVNVRIDSASLILRLDKGQKRLAYAAVNAINATARDVQKAAHEHVRQKFIIRKPGYFFGTPARPGGVAGRLFKASVGQGRAYAEVAVVAPTSQARRSTLLPLFEEGGTRKPFTPGAKSIAVPLEGRPARPSIRGPVPPQFTFAGLRFAAYYGGKRLRKKTTRSGDLTIFGEFGRRQDADREGAVQWKGRERTFILGPTPKAPLGGVFQRIGPKKGDIRMIYSFVPSVRIDSRLEFIPVATAEANARFGVHMDAEVKEVLEREAIRAIGRGV
jgi:hypothetical protein